MTRRLWMGLFGTAMASSGADKTGWKDLFANKSLDQWEIIGDGYWRVMRDGTVVGEREIRKTGPDAHWIDTYDAYKSWRDAQSWIYTKRNDFGDFDLHVKYWLRNAGNSGVSIRDTSRAEAAIRTPPDY